MAQRDEPSARERQLANDLRVLREAVGLSGKDAAAQLRWSPSKVSRIESGLIGISSDDLDRMLDLYAAHPDRAEQVRRLATSVRPKGWWDAFTQRLSPGYTNLIKLEDGSRALSCYCAVVPHALLQTQQYAMQVISSTLQRPSPAEIERRIDVHRRRQELVYRDDHPLWLSAVIDEAVFRRQIKRADGEVDRDAMRGQLEWLAHSAAMPNIAIRVLPFQAGLPPVTSGSFSILESIATQVPDVVYLENKTRIFFIESESEVYWYTQDFHMLRSLALSEADSLALIRQAIAEL
jgi:transcriptional regulator with XRE-family HTH domain